MDNQTESHADPDRMSGWMATVVGTPTQPVIGTRSAWDSIRLPLIEAFHKAT
jgi:hypothetical protein